MGRRDWYHLPHTAEARVQTLSAPAPVVVEPWANMLNEAYWAQATAEAVDARVELWLAIDFTSMANDHHVTVWHYILADTELELRNKVAERLADAFERAGEHGWSFKVIAGQIRALAPLAQRG